MVFRKTTDAYPEFIIRRDKSLCINCEVCVRQCSYGVHFKDTARENVRHDNYKCVGCQRCVAFCPTGALSIKKTDFVLPQIDFIRKNCQLNKFSFFDKLYLDICSTENIVNNISLSSQHISTNLFLLSSKTSVPINPNLLTAMEMVSAKLGLSFADAAGKHCKSIPATHNVADMAADIVKHGSDVIIIEERQFGAGPFSSLLPNEGMPIEFAVAVVDQRLKDEGLRNNVSVVADGKIRCSADVVKLIALGADAVCVGNVTMIAVGCTCCGQCFTGKCPWGIATTDPILCKRQNPEVSAEKIMNFINVWNREIQQILSAMDLTSTGELCGNREKLRSVGLSETERFILGVKHSGQ